MFYKVYVVKVVTIITIWILRYPVIYSQFVNEVCERCIPFSKPIRGLILKKQNVPTESTPSYLKSYSLISV